MNIFNIHLCSGFRLQHLPVNLRMKIISSTLLYVTLACPNFGGGVRVCQPPSCCSDCLIIYQSLCCEMQGRPEAAQFCVWSAVSDSAGWAWRWVFCLPTLATFLSSLSICLLSILLTSSQCFISHLSVPIPSDQWFHAVPDSDWGRLCSFREKQGYIPTVYSIGLGESPT